MRFSLVHSATGIYIKQNTMVVGGGRWPLWEKNVKGERKTEENHIKKRGKGLKNVSFWLRPARRNLFAGGKMKVWGGGEMIKIYIFCVFFSVNISNEYYIHF